MRRVNHRSKSRARCFKTVPSRKFGVHSFPARKRWLELGIICPCQAREAISQPAGLAELVFGDQDVSSDALGLGPAANF
ncbi:hypothetical protein K525DRAFT_260764, partial [Schizophyllum commune Loenen D]